MNAIAPGAVDTPMFRRNPGGGEALAAKALGTIPLHRIGTPQELAAVALFLGSDESSYLTGETLNVNGGSLTV